MAIEGGTPSKTYNVGSGKAYSLNELLDLMKAVTGRLPSVTYTSPRKMDVPVNYLDISRAKLELGWSPMVGVREGIARTWAALRQSFPS
jgi:nucleoside-diphosphate-sugar epimerase